MTAEVVDLNCVTTLDLPPEKVLRSALGAELTEVVVIGYDADGNSYFASSVADAGQVTWHLERAKWRLMRQCDDMENGEC